MSTNSVTERKLSPGLLGLYFARLARASVAVLSFGVAWITVARANHAPAIISVLPIVAMGLVPLTAHKWWPGVYLLEWTRARSASTWRVATGEEYSRMGAQRWLRRHPELSLTRIQALALARRRKEEADLLASLKAELPTEAFRLACARAAYEVKVGREPDAAEVERAAAELDRDANTGDPIERTVHVAIYKAIAEADRRGENRTDALTTLGRSIQLPPLSAGERGAILVRRGQGVAIFVLALGVYWVLCPFGR